MNPSTGRTLRAFEPLTPGALDERLGRAWAAFLAHRRRPIPERAGILARLADLLDERREELARLITLEMGKPVRAAREEVTKCAWCCRVYAAEAAGWLAEEVVATSAARSVVRYEPLGPVLAVMPWNFPFWQVVRFAAPALVAGNVVLLKHASNVPQCALALEALLREAGAPEGVFQTLLIPAALVERVLDDDRVAAVTLTGSEGAGRAIARAAGARIKKTVLELGGSDPFVVMASADLERAAATAVAARTGNAGQSCIAAKRFIVTESVAPAFERRLRDRFEDLRVGDPLDEDTAIGPLATAEVLATVERQVDTSVAAGARLVTGGRRLDRPGFYFAPTVLADVPPGAPAAREEVFGPVAALFPARDVDDAIRLANDTTFGLGASVWTEDAAERERFMSELETGMVFVGAMVASDPRLPFGGVKRSGYGRELGVWGLREFVNVKTIWIDGATHARAGAE